jgi:hypothetical protein
VQGGYIGIKPCAHILYIKNHVAHSLKVIGRGFFLFAVKRYYRQPCKAVEPVLYGHARLLIATETVLGRKNVFYADFMFQQAVHKVLFAQ